MITFAKMLGRSFIRTVGGILAALGLVTAFLVVASPIWVPLWVVTHFIIKWW